MKFRIHRLSVKFGVYSFAVSTVLLLAAFWVSHHLTIERMKGLSGESGREIAASVAVPVLSQASFWDLSDDLIPWMAVLLALAAVLTFYLSRRIHLRLNPMVALARAAERGHFEFPVPPPATDEFGVFEKAFYRMVRKIKEQTESLREKENRYRSIIETAAEGILTINEWGEIEMANPEIERLFGYVSKELIEKDFTFLIAPPYRQEYGQGGFMKLTGISLEVWGVRKDGKEFPMRLSLAEVRLSNRTIYTAIVRDESERHRQEKERRRMFYQLAHASKLASLGTMGAGVAHELNNPLAAVRGFAHLILQSFTQPKQVEEHAQKIIHATARMEKIVNHLRRFAREGKEGDWGIVDINDALRSVLVLMEKALAHEGIRLDLRLSPSPATIRGEITQIESIFQNFLSNSLDAFRGISDGREKRIEVVTGLDPSSGRVGLVFTDNAGGIPRSLISKVFDPFFTTKKVGEGTGLGLSIVHGIVTDHGGQIQIHSEKGVGTTFEIDFPMAGEELQKNEKRKESRAGVRTNPRREIGRRTSPKGRPKLLIVDDEEDIVEILESFLSEEFEVETSVEFQDAISRIQNGRFDLVLSDLRMPGGSGLQLFETAQALNPPVPVVLISGNAYLEEIERAQEAGLAAVLHKPFEGASQVVETLLEVIKRDGRFDAV